jgi:hypothetical protein
MSTEETKSIYRIRRTRTNDGVPKGYRYTLTVVDDHTRQTLARCDVSEDAVHSEVTITETRGRVWRLVPNRRVMPSRWTITDPDGRPMMTLYLRLLRKLANPMQRTALTIINADDSGEYRIVDARKSIADRVFAPRPADWSILNETGVVAKLTRLPSEEPKVTGRLSRLRAFLEGTDASLISFGPHHVFSAPVALGIQIIMDEVTDPSVG